MRRFRVPTIVAVLIGAGACGPDHTGGLAPVPVTPSLNAIPSSGEAAICTEASASFRPGGTGIELVTRTWVPLTVLCSPFYATITLMDFDATISRDFVDFRSSGKVTISTPQSASQTTTSIQVGQTNLPPSNPEWHTDVNGSAFECVEVTDKKYVSAVSRHRVAWTSAIMSTKTITVPTWGCVGPSPTVTLASTSVLSGSTIQATANCDDADRTWIAYPSDVATAATTTGVVLGLKAGSATVRVYCQGKWGDAAITVEAATDCGLEPASRVAAIGEAALDPTTCTGSDAPTPPPGGGGEGGSMVCYTVTRLYYEWDEGFGAFLLVDEVVLGTQCWLNGLAQ